MSIAPIVDYVKYQCQIFVKYVTEAFFCFANPRVCPEINLQAFETKYLYS